MRAVVLTVLLAVSAACAGGGGAPAAGSPADVREDPARLYRAKCSSCHRAYDRASRSREAWRAVLARMAPKAHLSPAEEDVLRGWLEAGASDAAPAR